MAYICIMAENYIYHRLKQEYQPNSILTRKVLFNFFRKYEPELNEATFAWRVFDLKKRNIIADLKTGIYTLNNKSPFTPQLSKKIKSISKLVNQRYDPHFYTIWDTISLNDLTELQATTSQVIVEIEKGFLYNIFYNLKDVGFAEVFVKPDENTMEWYISEAKHPIIIKPFLSRSPAQLIDKVKVPALEKILVDLYCDEQVYFAYQGHQLEIIYRNATSKYALNFSKLLTYAKRRSREDEIRALLMKVLEKDIKEIIQ